MRGRPRGRGPWYGDDCRRAQFECGARRWPGRATTLTKGARRGRLYRLRVDVPYYEPRQVEIFFPLNNPTSPRVDADGPTDSPHRYHADGAALCLFHPPDPPQLKWTFKDGLLRLVGLAIAHLFREAWWRETDEWLGPEAPHSTTKDPITTDDAPIAPVEPLHITNPDEAEAA